MKKLTHEEFIEKLLCKNEHFVNGDFDLIGLYVNSKEKISCHCNIHNYDWDEWPTELCRNKGCPICGKENSAKNRIIPRDVFIKRLKDKIPSVTLVGEYIDMATKTQFQCDKLHIWNATPNNVLCTLYGCPYCSGRYTLAGYNDIWTTRPDIAHMLKDPEDGYKYTAGSNKKAYFVCPDCGDVALKTINNVVSHGFGCQHCSDNVSYPNKFSRALLDQLPIDKYDCEYQPEWAKPYYYDNHFWYDSVEYILEMDGYLHFNEKTFSRTTLEQIQKKDRIKNELAAQHNIHMIRIDCKKSDMEYIKSNIFASELKNVFDLSNIDWLLCDQKGQRNILKEACKLYMSKMYTLTDIGKILCVHPTTVSHYLRKGSKFGWCDYIPQKAKSITVVNDDEQIIHLFDSIAECGRVMQQLYRAPFYPEGIRNSCKTHKPYKGFNFRFANETIQN